MQKRCDALTGWGSLPRPYRCDEPGVTRRCGRGLCASHAAVWDRWAHSGVWHAAESAVKYWGWILR